MFNYMITSKETLHRGFVMAAILAASSSALAQTDPFLCHSGVCGGDMTFTVFDATPAGQVAITYGFQGGASGPVPGCAGLFVDIEQARLGALILADDTGVATLQTYVPPAACDRTLVQAVDLSACRTSNVILISDCPGCECAPPDVVFSQLNFVLDDVPVMNSDWGRVDFTFVGQAGIQYVNLAANGTWQLRNMPLLSVEGEGVEQTISYTFDLGNEPGEEVMEGFFDFVITDEPLDSMPDGGDLFIVWDQDVVYWRGAEEMAVPPLESAGPGDGGESSGPKHTNSDFPNQQCKPNQCTPTAVSNSLQFLNAKHNLGMDAADITIAKMLQATKWKVPPRRFGCYINDNSNGSAWWKDKNQYMLANGLPITTTSTTSFADVANALDNNCDIEIQGDWHTAAVVGLTPLADGKYSVDISHDTDQNDDTKGTTTETITWDPTTKKFSGSPGYFNGSVLKYFVIECPKK
ncbi:MAG: hypothetical protein HND57_06750 [Planctomycetes bacterium]|nr:hypothetical protein [Planctomycetota bacterium]